jgi:hypothetical protein
VNDQKQREIARRVLCAVDLAIDFATLGEYGLEPLPAGGPCRKQPGHRIGWEGFATARRGGCANRLADPRRDRCASGRADRVG